MRILNKVEYTILEALFKSKQKAVKTFLDQYLSQYYLPNEIKSTNSYICAIGDIPIALCAHMDTVWEDAPPKNIFYDKEKGALWSPVGLGADDKAGIFAIIKILEAGLRPHIIFTTDEEIGGLGAQALALDGNPFPELKYIIELDRQGKEDCVFYECKNTEFQSYIETFGFKTALGSFSDISILCPAWQVCGVNLSIGYINEHTYSEMLFIKPMFATIEKVKKILRIKNDLSFNWKGKIYKPQPVSDTMKHKCYKCKNEYPLADLITVKTKDGKGVHFYCNNCFSVANCGINFCNCCDMPYEEEGGDLNTGLCATCIKNFWEG